MKRRFRVRRDLLFAGDLLRAGEIVTEADLHETGPARDEFKRILSGRQKGRPRSRLGGAAVLFWWNGRHRTAEFGRDLELVRGENGGWSCR